MTADSIAMKKINATGVIPSGEEIAVLEKEIGHRLPKEYIDLMGNLDAEFPSSNSFPTIMRGKWVHQDEVHEFYPFSRLSRVYREFLADDEPLWEGGPAINMNGDTDIAGYLPIAETTEFMSSGLFLKIDETQDDYGAVYYLNSSGDYNCHELVKIAPSLADFMTTLTAVDWGKSEIDLSKCGRVESSGDSIEVILERARARRLGKKS